MNRRLKWIALGIIVVVGYVSYLKQEEMAKTPLVESKNSEATTEKQKPAFAINCRDVSRTNNFFSIYSSKGKGFFVWPNEVPMKISQVQFDDMKFKFRVDLTAVTGLYSYSDFSIDRNTLDTEEVMTSHVGDSSKRERPERFQCSIIDGVNPEEKVQQLSLTYEANEQAKREQSEKDKQKQLNDRKI